MGMILSVPGSSNPGSANTGPSAEMGHLPPRAVARTLRSIVAATLRMSGGEAAARLEDDPDGDLGPDGLRLDSLELLACSQAASEFFCLPDAGNEDMLIARRSLAGWVRTVAEAQAAGVRDIRVASSGSTGAPSAWRHSLTDLWGETLHWRGVFADRRRILALVPAHHIYGFLFTALLPEALGCDLVPIGLAQLPSLRRRVRAGDLVVGVPSLLGALHRAGEPPCGDIEIVSAGARLPVDLSVALRRAGATRVHDVYGSTETAGIGHRDDPAAAFRLLPTWLADPADPDILIRRRDGSRHALPDLVAWQYPDHLRPLRRRDGVVQVGGENVSPDAVARRIAAHDLVADCTVRLDTSLVEPRLKAFVVPRHSHVTQTDRADFDAWCRGQFRAAERPVSVRFGAALPRTALGKLADWSTTD